MTSFGISWDGFLGLYALLLVNTGSWEDGIAEVITEAAVFILVILAEVFVVMLPIHYI